MAATYEEQMSEEADEKRKLLLSLGIDFSRFGDEELVNWCRRFTTRPEGTRSDGSTIRCYHPAGTESECMIYLAYVLRTNHKIIKLDIVNIGQSHTNVITAEIIRPLIDAIDEVQLTHFWFTQATFDDDALMLIGNTIRKSTSLHLVCVGSVDTSLDTMEYLFDSLLINNSIQCCVLFDADKQKLEQQRIKDTLDDMKARKYARAAYLSSQKIKSASKR